MPSATAGTTPAIEIVPCMCGLQYLKIWVTGGTAGTDGCYFTFGAPSVCTSVQVLSYAAKPAPNAATAVGDWIPTGLGNPVIYNAAPSTSQPNSSPYWMGGEVDAACTASGMSISWVGIRPGY